MSIDKEKIRKKIQEEITKTEGRIAEYKEMTKPVAPENAIGRLSRMDAINNKSVMEAGLRQAQDKLEKLKYVATQVDGENFGICKKCNREIPLGRILLMPHSFYCVNCAT